MIFIIYFFVFFPSFFFIFFYSIILLLFLFFFFTQKTAYELRISDWSSDVFSSDLIAIMLFHTVTCLLPVEHQDLMLGTFLSVDIFFLLSGFLITSLLVEERARTGATSLRGFYGRRALRLLPALGALLIGTTAYVVVTGLDLWVHLRTCAMIVSYTSNWFFGRNAEITDGMGHMWTLAIEEQFYILWPLAVIAVLGLAAARHGGRALAGLLLAGIVVSVASRFLLWESSEIWSRVYFHTDARMDLILLGCLLAVACHEGWLRARPRPWLAAGAAAGLLWFFWWAIPYDGWYYRGGATLTGLPIGALLLAALVPSGPVGWVLTTAPLRYTGRISYSLYL